MLSQVNLSNPVLINTIGHTAGILLFGLVIILIARDWIDHGIRQTRLSLIAALLALGWNVGSLIALASNDQTSMFIEIVMTASFGILSMLPAVLLQVVLHGSRPWIVQAGYVVSAVAVILHFGELFLPTNPVLHHAALLLIAIGFAVLTVVAFVARRKQPVESPPGTSDWVLLGALLVFSSSFLHFGYEHVSSPWAVEIAWHHIGIPVALIVLLQDYRFLLLDTFIRFLINSSLAAIYIAALITLGQRFLAEGIRSSAFLMGLSLVMLCLSLVLFAYLRNRLQTWISKAIFRRQDLEACISKIVQLAAAAETEQDLFTLTAQEAAQYLRAEQFVVLDEPMSTRRPEKPSVMFADRLAAFPIRPQFRAEAQIPLRFSSGDTRYLVAGVRRGGRRYLSEELEDMRRLATVIVEQVERFRAEELKRLVSQAELRALQAQINPHFLFNALNTLYGTIDRQSHEARRMVLNLADIFRYLLQSDRTTIQLSEELRIVRAYLEIEKLRLGDRLETELVVSEGAGSTMIPILSIQPLVENAVKHGIAAKSDGGRVCLRAERSSRGLTVSVEDTGVGFEQSARQLQQGTGLGLENVRRRLMLSYGPGSDLNISSSSLGTTVTFFVPEQLSRTHSLAELQVMA